MKTWCIALEVLYRIYVCMQDVRTLAQLPADRGLPLHEPVVVGIHACNHVWPQLVHHCGFLALHQRGVGGKHYLEANLGALELVQDAAPESYVVITFYVRNNPACCLTRLKPVCRLDPLR